MTVTGDVGGDEMAVDRGGGRKATFPVEIEDRHLRAIGGEAFGSRLAEARGPAGDDGWNSVDVHGDFLSGKFESHGGGFATPDA